MVDSRRDVAGQAGRSPSPSVQATMIGLMAILLWSLMTGLVRVVADAFGATLGSALIYTCGAVLLLVFRRPAPLRKYPRTYLIVGGLLFVFYESSISLSIGLASSAASSVEVSLVNYLWPTMMVLLAAAFVPSGEKRSARNEGIGREPAAPSDAQAQDDSVQCGTNCSAGKPPRHSRGRAVLRVLPDIEDATSTDPVLPEALPSLVPVSDESDSEPTPDGDCLNLAPSADRRERAAALRDLGWSNKKIARELDVHPSTVGRWLTAHIASPDDESTDKKDTNGTSEGLSDQATNHKEKS